MSKVVGGGGQGRGSLVFYVRVSFMEPNPVMMLPSVTSGKQLVSTSSLWCEILDIILDFTLR